MDMDSEFDAYVNSVDHIPDISGISNSAPDRTSDLVRIGVIGVSQYFRGEPAIEGLVLFLGDLLNAENFYHCVSAFLHLKNVFPDIEETVLTIIRKCYSNQAQNKSYNPIFEFFSADVNPFTVMRENLTSSQIPAAALFAVEAYEKLVMFTVAFSVLPSIGWNGDASTVPYKSFVKTRRALGGELTWTSFFKGLNDNLLAFLEMGWERFVIGDKLHPVGFQEWSKEVLFLRDNFHHRQDETNDKGVSRSEYAIRIQKAKGDGEYLVNKLIAEGLSPSSMNRYLGILDSLVSCMESELLSSGVRKVPFGVLLYGAPKVGKTTMVYVLFKVAAEVMRKPHDLKYLATINSFEEFMSSYDPSKYAIFMDDIGSLQENGTVDQSLANIINIINSTMVASNQAELEKKGKYVFNNDIAFATSNIDITQLTKTFKATGAIARRFPFTVHITVKQEYTLPDGIQLDESKVDPTDLSGPLLFHLKKVHIDINGNAKFVPYTDDPTDCTYDIQGIIPVYCRMLREHIKEQERQRVKREENMQSSMCEHDRLFNMCVDCNQAQMANVWVLPVFLSILFYNWFTLSYTRYSHHLYHILYNRVGFGPAVLIFFVACSNYMLGNLGLLVSVILLGPAVRETYNKGLLRNYFIEFMTSDYAINIPIKIRRYMMYYIMVNASDPAELFHYYALYKAPDKGVNFFHKKTTRDLITFLRNSVLVVALGMTVRWTIAKAQKYNTDHTVYAEMDAKKEPTPIWQVLPRIPRFSVSERVRTTGKADFKRMVQKNTYRIRTKNGGGNGTLICDRYMLVVAHAFTHGEPITGEMEISWWQDHEPGKLHPVGKAVVTAQDMCHVGSDILCVFVPNIPCGYDLRPFMLSEVEHPQIKHQMVELISRDERGFVVDNERTMCSFSSTIYNLTADKQTFIENAVQHGTPLPGACGGTLIMTDWNFIVGIHVSGRMAGARLGWASPLCREMVDSIVHGQMVAHRGRANMYDFLETIPVSRRCRGNYMSGSGDMIASYPGNMPKLKSKIYRTVVADAVIDKEPSLAEYGIPNFKRSNGDWSTDPWRVGLMKLTRLSSPVPRKICNRAVIDFMDRIAPKVDYFMLDIGEAINGHVDKPWLNRLNMQSSSGFPLYRRKSDLLPVIEVKRDGTKVYGIDDNTADLLGFIMDRYVKWEISSPPFKASLKDELRLKTKLALGKIRIFMGAPLSFTIAQRMIMGFLIKLFMENRVLCETAIGMNPHSEQWEEVVPKGKSFCGDYQGFDGSFKVNVVRSIFSILAARCPNKQHANLIFVMGAEIATPVVIFVQDLIRLFGINPSGQPLTTIINGVWNSILVRIAFFLCRYENFSRHIHVRTYGDDIVIESNLDEFNWDRMARVLSFLVKFTLADKSDRRAYFQSIGELTFLKRGMRREFNAWFAPLEVASIMKSLAYTATKVPEGSHLRDVFTRALFELSVHPQEIFEDYSQWLYTLASRYNISLPILSRMQLLLILFGEDYWAKRFPEMLSHGVPGSTSVQNELRLTE
jgi:hypothetical protein